MKPKHRVYCLDANDIPRLGIATNNESKAAEYIKRKKREGWRVMHLKD